MTETQARRARLEADARLTRAWALGGVLFDRSRVQRIAAKVTPYVTAQVSDATRRCYEGLKAHGLEMNHSDVWGYFGGDGEECIRRADLLKLQRLDNRCR
jgi:hypothetical protein